MEKRLRAGRRAAPVEIVVDAPPPRLVPVKIVTGGREKTILVPHAPRDAVFVADQPPPPPIADARPGDAILTTRPAKRALTTRPAKRAPTTRPAKRAPTTRPAPVSRPAPPAR